MDREREIESEMIKNEGITEIEGLQELDRNFLLVLYIINATAVIVRSGAATSIAGSVVG